jgi:DNA-binding response OmpR family regulator
MRGRHGCCSWGMPLLLHDSVSSPTILIVDDNAELVEFLCMYLSRQGMRVLTAYNGRPCLEVACQQTIDVIVLDVAMPEMNGLETGAVLKALPATRAIPVLLLTAKDDHKTRLAGIRAGICEFLTKPIQGKVLFKCIRTLLAVRQWERRLDELASPASLDEVQM